MNNDPYSPDIATEEQEALYQHEAAQREECYTHEAEKREEELLK